MISCLITPELHEHTEVLVMILLLPRFLFNRNHHSMPEVDSTFLPISMERASFYRLMDLQTNAELRKGSLLKLLLLTF